MYAVFKIWLRKYYLDNLFNSIDFFLISISALNVVDEKFKNAVHLDLYFDFDINFLTVSNYETKLEKNDLIFNFCPQQKYQLKYLFNFHCRQANKAN